MDDVSKEFAWICVDESNQRSSHTTFPNRNICPRPLVNRDLKIAVAFQLDAFGVSSDRWNDNFTAPVVKAPMRYSTLPRPLPYNLKASWEHWSSCRLGRTWAKQQQKNTWKIQFHMKFFGEKSEALEWACYNDPNISGFSTFDLSARETSHTTGQHLRDSRALSGIKLVRPHCDPMKKKWSKKLHCTLLRPSIRTRNELPPTRIALAFVSPIKFWKWSQGCWCRLTSTLRSVKVTPHRLICCFTMHQCWTSFQAYWL